MSQEDRAYIQAILLLLSIVFIVTIVCVIMGEI